MNILDATYLIVPDVYIEALSVKNRKMFILNFKNKDYLFICDSEKVNHYALMNSCTRLFPLITPILQSRECILIEYVEAETAADVIMYSLTRGKLVKLLPLAFAIGETTALLHRQLANCSHSREELRPSSLTRVLNERCELALSLNDAYHYVIKKICADIKNKLKYIMKKFHEISIGHGDLHLYQVLVGKEGLKFVDPGPEPGTLTWPSLEYDIAALLRSFEYIEYMVSFGFNEFNNIAYKLGRIMLLGYMRTNKLPPPEVLEVFYLIRTVYEYYYERANKTGLENIPLSTLKAYISNRATIVRRLMNIGGSSYPSISP